MTEIDKIKFDIIKLSNIKIHGCDIKVNLNQFYKSRHGFGFIKLKGKFLDTTIKFYFHVSNKVEYLHENKILILMLRNLNFDFRIKEILNLSSVVTELQSSNLEKINRLLIDEKSYISI